jgi:hypothetical protein
MTRSRLRIAAAVLVVAMLAGCGASTLSVAQLRNLAGRICLQAAHQMDGIPGARSPADGARFLSRGIAVLSPELRQLRGFHTDSRAYAHALQASSAELAALRFTLRGLRAGNDPVVAIKTLQQRLAPLERKAAEAWAVLVIPKCVAR